MLLAAITSLSLTFTLPTTEATPGCVPVVSPLDDLSTVEVHFWPRWASRDTTLYVTDVVGQEGVRMTVQVTVDSEGVLWVETVDVTGNHSCQSNYVVVAYTTDVPLKEIPPVGAVWYDVAGRRYRSEPTVPGIYVRVQGSEHRKVVIQH
jgi:hypothetical protein